MFNKKFSEKSMMWLSFIQAICWALFSIVFFRRSDVVGGFIFVVLAVTLIIVGIGHYIQNKKEVSE